MQNGRFEALKTGEGCGVCRTEGRPVRKQREGRAYNGASSHGGLSGHAW